MRQVMRPTNVTVRGSQNTLDSISATRFDILGVLQECLLVLQEVFLLRVQCIVIKRSIRLEDLVLVLNNIPENEEAGTCRRGFID